MNSTEKFCALQDKARDNELAARLSKFGLSLDRPTQRAIMKAAQDADGLMYGGRKLRWVVSDGQDSHKFFESLADVDFYVSYLEDLASMPGN